MMRRGRSTRSESTLDILGARSVEGESECIDFSTIYDNKGTGKSFSGGERAASAFSSEKN